MGFYLFTGSYSTDAIKAMVNKPQDREAAARAAIKSVGGKLHSFFFTFGESDVIAILEADDDIAAAATSLLVGAGGGLAHGATTKLLTAAEAKSAMARAKKARGKYKPPS